ncbi:hypothetical protein G7Y89_g10219 [Cudoniella acicularis]|uniref:SGNH hydrolase-type esterase domain-containing protein n=1 Tax=Cudoniella acicularis TaxID=354080 RepID=A0A8H4RD64_9HELO|nr:hypothetical protein G7Y89_g10219 [Cudoniella acicularis]
MFSKPVATATAGTHFRDASFLEVVSQQRMKKPVIMIMTKSLHILCFGDSLTHGYSKMGALYHPYSIALQASLEKAFPTMNITIDEQGQNGDQVTSPPGGFLPRMDILYEEVHPTDPYTHAIILGGTNDLTQKRLPSDIYKSLQLVWDIPLGYNTTVLSLTVPEIALDPPIVPNGRLDKLNSKILNHKGGDNFHTLDLHSKVPYWDLPEARRKEIWDDGVHFTAKGYDLIGNILADKIINLVTGVVTVPENNVWVHGSEKEELKRDNVMKMREVGFGAIRKRLRSGRGVEIVEAEG